MINKKIGVLLLFALLVSFGAKAQRATSMRINEVLVINEDNFVDDYGKRHAWIEYVEHMYKHYYKLALVGLAAGTLFSASVCKR